jgi:hypothetical protein
MILENKPAPANHPRGGGRYDQRPLRPAPISGSGGRSGSVRRWTAHGCVSTDPPAAFFEHIPRQFYGLLENTPQNLAGQTSCRRCLPENPGAFPGTTSGGAGGAEGPGSFPGTPENSSSSRNLASSACDRGAGAAGCRGGATGWLPRPALVRRGNTTSNQ